jgi:hypothetical protein
MVPIEPITRSRAKKIKEAFNELIQSLWVLFPTRLADSTYFSTYTSMSLFFVTHSFILASIIFNVIIGSSKILPKVFKGLVLCWFDILG